MNPTHLYFDIDVSATNYYLVPVDSYFSDCYNRKCIAIYCISNFKRKFFNESQTFKTKEDSF
ncbi:hypothetical protein Bcop_1816 [Bacteroides coprosuis DSM 18011]|uniref:Uncharacterized protein n=1 Tax=Bacteroides coprosuis DSM 18011 TaxID=679937 RepID=F3ZRR5_9BACE|nr:hypothetical protein Bcop_1816 [Bacteroides coprosuis DSM 18011]